MTWNVECGDAQPETVCASWEMARLQVASDIGCRVTALMDDIAQNNFATFEIEMELRSLTDAYVKAFIGTNVDEPFELYVPYVEINYRVYEKEKEAMSITSILCGYLIPDEGEGVHCQFVSGHEPPNIHQWTSETKSVRYNSEAQNTK